MQLIDPTHPFYRPLWVRVLIVAICLGWTIVEASTSEPFWAVLIGAVGIYAAWMLLVNFNPMPVEKVGATGEDKAGEPDGDEGKS